MKVNILKAISFITIYEVLVYVKELTSYEAIKSVSSFYLVFALAHFFWSAIFVNAIIDISLDAESCEEQDGVNRFLIGATAAKLWAFFS